MNQPFKLIAYPEASKSGLRREEPMTAYLFRNVEIWDGEVDDRYPGEVLVVGN